MGFYKFSHLQKTRRKCRYKEYEICLDVIDTLGSYIEVEKMSSGDDEKTQEELFTFLESLGVKRKDRETRGYDIIMVMSQEKHEANS